MSPRWIGAVLAAAVVVLMVSSTFGLITSASVAPTGAAVLPATVASPAPSTGAASTASSTTPATVTPASPLCTEAALNSPATVAANQAEQHFTALTTSAIAAGAPAGVLRPPNVVGATTSANCIDNNESDPAPAPAGVSYDGQIDTTGTPHDLTLDTNSVEGTLTVDSTNNLYPDSLSPTLWGDQLNVVLTNVTILGHRGYSFWVQSLAEYNQANQTLWFYDATWNFTTGSSVMQTTSLVNWSPNSGNYTGIWLLADTPYIHAPLPYTINLYVNSSVNSAGDQVLWYNYSIQTPGHFYANGNYDYIVFRSQAPGAPQTLTPAPFEASATEKHSVDEGYEFDVMIGTDDGTNQLILGANATEQVRYCTLAVCTPTNFAYASVPAAVNYGSQTGETTVGLSINYIGTTAYLTAGPFIEHGLWNYTGQTGVVPGQTKVINAISVSGSPLALSAQPYIFAFFESTNYTSQGYQWGADAPAWFLMPGTYNYELMLADYQEQTGTIVVGSSTVTLTAVLPYASTSGVYTPLWAFSNAQLAGISTSGNGAIGSQYVLFNNPTSSCTFCGSAPNANLSANFYLANDYHFTTYAGIILDGTSAYVTINNPPSFCVHASGSTYYYLAIWFYNTSHVTLSHASGIRGWPTMEEWDFYLVVPAAQNNFPQGDVDVLSSTSDLIMENTFVAVKPSSTSYVSPDQIVLHGGSGNVVWGNTFRDPPGVALGTTYAGIGEDEGGDLIYNNNFSIDNPVVTLPFNISNDAECLPQCTSAPGNPAFWNVGVNTWNVTPQAASNVAETVNGYALSGNVLGPSVTTQGGNYFYNIGTSPNNITTSPYVSRFLYTDWSNLYPLGCPSVQVNGQPCGTAPALVGSYQNGMPAGSGDYAPYGAFVRFTETGLAPGGEWAVSFNGKLYTSTGTTIGIPIALLHSFTWAASAITGGVVASPSSGSGLAWGEVIHVAFAASAPSYAVYFTESGLPTGTLWGVIFNSVEELSTGPTIEFNETAGSYGYLLTLVTDYTGSPSTGTLTVSNSPLSIGIVYTPVTYTVTFTETGLTGSFTWAIAFGGALYWSTSTTITFTVAAGTYTWVAAVVSGHNPSPESGSMTVTSGTNAQTVVY